MNFNKYYRVLVDEIPVFPLPNSQVKIDKLIKNDVIKITGITKLLDQEIYTGEMGSIKFLVPLTFDNDLVMITIKSKL